MPGMKISLDAAMRARDVSQPTPADEVAAARLADAVGSSQVTGPDRAVTQERRPAVPRPRKRPRPPGPYVAG